MFCLNLFRLGDMAELTVVVKDMLVALILAFNPVPLWGAGLDF